ncbi:5753_t:CDS:2, partial [Funneliformis geosporum]
LATSQAAETVAITTIENLNNQIKKITEDNRLLNERKQAESKKVDQAKKEAGEEISQKNSKIAELEAKLEKSLEEEKKLRQAQATELASKRVDAELAEEFEALRTTKDSELAAHELKIEKDTKLLEASEAAITKAEKKWESLNTNYIKLEKERDEIQEQLIKAEN